MDKQEAKDMKILIIDDSKVMGKLTSRNVMSLGYQVDVRASSTEALTYVGNNKVDLILMDIELIGSRYDGIQTTKFIRKKYNIPVIFLTGHDNADIFEEANLDTSFNVIMKPFELKQLKMQIDIAIYNNQIQKEFYDLDNWTTALLCNMKNGVIMLGKDKKIKDINRIALETIGIEKSKLISQDIFKVIKTAFIDEKQIGIKSISSIEEIHRHTEKGSFCFIIGKDIIKINMNIIEVTNNVKEKLGWLMLFTVI